MSTEPTTITAPGTSILIVDDNPQFSGLLQRILKAGFGYQDVTAVASTQAAYELITHDPERFKMLFVDYHFPEGTTGGELLQQLQSHALLGNKIAFLITSEPTPDNQKEAQRAGAKGVVAKPFDRDKIRSQLEKVERALQLEQGEHF